MKRFGTVFVAMMMCCAVALGADDDPANIIWSILGGVGVWGALFVLLTTFAWKYLGPFLAELSKKWKIERLYNAVEDAMHGVAQTYMDEIKDKAKDGKVTEAEAAHARELAKDFLIDFMKKQGVDVVREYGHELIDFLIEAFVKNLKLWEDNSNPEIVVA